jgi:hypothetical protein
MRSAYPSPYPVAGRFGADETVGAALKGSSPSTPAGGAASDRGYVVHTAIDKAIHRLEDLIDEETAALRDHKAIDLKDFNNRKNQALYELSRASRLVEDLCRTPEVKERLQTLRDKLEENRCMLKIHIEAAREVLTIMTDAIQHAESDGTYSVSIRNGGKKP